MTREEALEELRKYVGIPKCQDCGWKLDSEITNNCACTGSTPEKEARHHKAFERARELQRIGFV